MDLKLLFAVFLCVLSLHSIKAYDYDVDEDAEQEYRAPESEALKSVISHNAQFSIKFIKAIATEQRANFVSSPLSLWFALSMAYFGATGETANIMKTQLNLPEDTEILKQGLQELVANLTNIHEDVQLKIVNKVLIRQGSTIKPEYKDVVTDTFGVTPETVDFTHPALPRNLNNFISEATNNKINNVFPERNAFNALTKMVLLNAVYLKAKWESPFEKRDTKTAPFYQTETSILNVPFMFKEFDALYTFNNDLDASIIELPYKGKKTSMMVVVPQRKLGLPNLEKKILNKDVGNLLRNARRRNVKLYLPKFRVESTLNLERSVRSMGMESIFSETAQFTGITQFQLLKISNIIQKTFIQVDEESTEVAVVTQVAFVDLSAIITPRYIELKADHPFLFYIVHRTAPDNDEEDRKPVVLFAGRVDNPRS